MRVSQKTLRSVVHRLLLEMRDEDNMERTESPDVKMKIPIGSRDLSPKIGTKYAYEDAGSPECVVVAMIGASEVCTTYSQATIKDPVRDGHGRLLTQSEVDQIADGKIPFWNAFDVNSMASISPEPRQLYEKAKLFVPTRPRRPAFESTQGARVKAGEMGCALDAKGFIRELKIFFSSLPASPAVFNLETPPANFFEITQWMIKNGDQVSLSRIMPCFRATTVDSFFFGIIQGIIGVLGPIGAAADVGMDAIPGFIVVAYYMHIKQYQLAAYYTIQTIVFMCMPALISRWIGKPIVAFIVNIIGIGIILKFSRMISIRLLGEDIGIPQSDVDAVVREVQENDMTLEDLKASAISGIFDPQGLPSQYPQI